MKDYFVNNNGDVFITTKIPFSPKPTTATHAAIPVTRKNNFTPSFKRNGKSSSLNSKLEKKEFLPTNVPTALPLKSLDLEPLLEEPLKDGFGHNNDDDVEVIQSNDEETTEIESTTLVTLTDIPSMDILNQTRGSSEEIEDHNNITTTPLLTTMPHSEELTTLPKEYAEHNSDSPSEYSYSEELYDEVEDKDNTSNENDIQNEYSEHSAGAYDGKEKSDSKEKQVNTILLFIMCEMYFFKLNKKMRMIFNFLFQLEEVKEELTGTTQKLDSTFEIITMKPTKKMREHDFHDFVDTLDVDSTEAPSLIETTTIPMTISMSSSVVIKKGDKIISSQEEVDEPEVVISVVTSKTVVNNTIIASATPAPPVTKALQPTTESYMIGSNENTTDTWVVVASVQTSRSVSGAR